MNEKALKRQMSSRWALLVLGVILLLFLGLIYGWSIFRSPLQSEFGWTDSQASLTFSISMMTFCLGGLVGGIAGVTVYQLAPAMNFLNFLGYVGGSVNNVVWAAIAAAVALIVGCVATILIGFDEDEA